MRAGVRACAGHPAVLCYAIGNEIPASIVRWYGARRVERFLERLYRAVKAEDPGASSPTSTIRRPSTCASTSSISSVSTSTSRREAPRGLPRPPPQPGWRPAAAHGRDRAGQPQARRGAQARSLDWQVRTTFAAGCAGAFVFAWTDEWHRGGYDIEDWDFGLTSRDRTTEAGAGGRPRAFAEVPFPADVPWPRVSVVVCSLQRRAHHPGLPRRAARAGVPGLRGDRRRRRFDRRNGGDRRRVRRPPHQRPRTGA